MATKITVKNVRIGYEHVFEANSFDNNEPRYSCVLLIPKTDAANVQAISDALGEAYALGKADPKKWAGKDPAVVDYALKDGDLKDHEKNPEYAGHWYINAKDKNKPLVVDRNRNLILDTSKVYSGCFCNVIVNFFPFLNKGKYGISASLQGVQLVADGERLSGGGASIDDFDDLGGGTSAPAQGFRPPFGS